MRRRLALLCLLCVPLTLSAAAPAGPPALAHWHFGGDAVMRFWGLKIYAIRLWHVSTRYDATAPFALELEYAREFAAEDIVTRSLAEMRAQGHTDPTQLDRWRTALRAVIPDVRAGDRLLGIAYPGREAQFYAAGRHLGTIADPAFVDAFFGIWLSERTSAPAVRARLLADRT